MTQAEAIEALENAWYFVKIEKVPAYGNDGEVLTQSIDDHTEHPAGTEVTIGVCVKQTNAEVPDLRGKTLDEIMDILAEAHLSLGELSYEPSTAAEGTVIDQVPSPGSHTEFNTEVNIVLSEQIPE